MPPYTPLPILYRLARGTPVSIWFNNSGFIPTFFQFTCGCQAAFSGGGLNGGLTYINVHHLAAIRVG